jgi:hypothetical protein
MSSNSAASPEAGYLNPGMSYTTTETSRYSGGAEPGIPSLSGRLFGIALLGLACLTILMAWPRLQASVHFLPVDTALGLYFDRKEIPSAQLLPLANRARETLDLHPHYRYWQGLGLLHYLRALDPATPSWERESSLRRSLTAVTQAVSRSPVSPYSWLQLAQVRHALGFPPGEVIGVLEMSWLTGRVEPLLLLPRVELGFRYVAQMNAGQKAQLGDQAALAWRIQRHQFRLSLESGQLDWPTVKDLMAGEQAAVLEDMEAELDPPA